MNTAASKYTSFYLVEKKDVPVSCPPKEEKSWNLHPRVFLQFDDKKQAICPYCGNAYQLA